MYSTAFTPYVYQYTYINVRRLGRNLVSEKIVSADRTRTERAKKQKAAGKPRVSILGWSRAKVEFRFLVGLHRQAKAPPAAAFVFRSPLSARQDGAHNIADHPVLLTIQGRRKNLQRLEHVDVRVHLRAGRQGTAGRIGGGRCPSLGFIYPMRRWVTGDCKRCYRLKSDGFSLKHGFDTSVMKWYPRTCPIRKFS